MAGLVEEVPNVTQAADRAEVNTSTMTTQRDEAFALAKADAFERAFDTSRGGRVHAAAQVRPRSINLAPSIPDYAAVRRAGLPRRAGRGDAPRHA